MAAFDQNYWTQRWKAADTGWDVGYAATPLAEYIRQLADKNLRILVPGAGNAYEGVLLHQLGFKNTVILDIAPEPLQQLRENHPVIPPDCIVQGDFFNHKGTYDVILEQTFFCAIDPALRRKYFETCHALLITGGKLVGVLFNDVFNKPYPPFGGSPEEYKLLFNDLFELRVYEACRNSIKPRQGREWFMILIKKD